MSHENSQTVQIGGRWYNVRGGTAEPLRPAYPFEKESYDTVTEAVTAARRRSALGGGPHGRESVPVDPRTGRLQPYGPNPFLYGQLARMFTGQTAPASPTENPLRTRVVKRLRPDLLTGTRGGSMTLADVLRSATGLGSQLFGSAGGGLAEVLRDRQMPEPSVSPTAPPVTGSPFVDVDTAQDPLAALGPIASLQTPDQAVARDLAAMVEAGKITMAEAAQRYREYRFGGR